MVKDTRMDFDEHVCAECLGNILELTGFPVIGADITHTGDVRLQIAPWLFVVIPGRPHPRPYCMYTNGLRGPKRSRFNKLYMDIVEFGNLYPHLYFN